MANIVNLDRAAKSYAAGTVLEGVSLGVDDTDRIGVVGLNGAGKTTLLRLLTRALEPDSGRVTHRRDLRVAALPQTLDLPPAATVSDVVVGCAWLPAEFAAEHEWAGDSAVRSVLDGLGMAHLGLDTEIGPMSGGERRRVALAALLVRQTDLLILDEPTNHLDVAGVDWLAAHLRTRRGAIVVVTHDRWFLDAVCTRIWEVADGVVRAYEGGYAAWTLARVERERVAAAVEARRQNLLRKEIAWLRRGPPARTSKPKFRIEAANALIADVPEPRDPVSLRRLATARLGKQVYELESVTLTVGDRTLLDDVTWRIGPGDRVAILGANGAGKTTLLRVLAGERPPQAGTVRRGLTVRPGYLPQELPADLRPGAAGPGPGGGGGGGSGLTTGAPKLLESIEEVARHVKLGDRELSATQLAEVFGFTGGQLWTPVTDLSGGQRRRLQFLRLLAGEPNVLLLDEPTNDLDVDTLAALEDLLDTWPGTLIVASHDRYLVERVCETTIGLLDGALLDLPGGVDEYLRRQAGTRTRRTAGPAGASAGTTGGSGGRAARSSGTAASEPTPGGADRTAPSAPSAAAARSAKKELARLARLVEKLERRESQLHEQLAAHATDYQQVTELDAQLRAVRAERTDAEEAWLNLAELMPESA